MLGALPLGEGVVVAGAGEAGAVVGLGAGLPALSDAAAAFDLSDALSAGLSPASPPAPGFNLSE